MHECFWVDHILSIAAMLIVVGESRHRAQVLFSSLAIPAVHAGGIQPRHSNPVAFFELLDSWSASYHSPHHLMTTAMVFIRISRHANVRALMGRSNVLEVLLGHVDLLVDGIGKGGAQ